MTQTVKKTKKGGAAKEVPALFFGNGNAKIPGIFTFSLPSGYSCPGADICLSKAHVDTGVITDGPKTRFRCFSASQEAAFPSVRRSRWKNYQALVSRRDMVGKMNLILDNLPKKAKIVRIHVAGDFFNQDYFDAWLGVAERRPDILFYAYTKSIPYWIARIGFIPDNLKLVASRGGRHDRLIEKYGLRYAEVVYSEQEAREKGLPIDHDDSHAYASDESFALLVHSTQPKGSLAAKAISAMKAEGVKFSYSSK